MEIFMQQGRSGGEENIPDGRPDDRFVSDVFRAMEVDNDVGAGVDRHTQSPVSGCWGFQG